jgi:hypothetical protein
MNEIAIAMLKKAKQYFIWMYIKELMQNKVVLACYSYSGVDLQLEIEEIDDI